LRGMKPIEIHQQLSETCNDGVMDVKNVRSWVRQVKEGRTSCENKPKEPPPRTSRSEDMISAFSGRHARWFPQIQRICRHWQLSVSQSSGGLP